MSTTSPIAVGHLTNAIRNGGRTTDIRIAEAIGSVAQAVNANGSILNSLISNSTSPVAPDNTVTINGIPVSF